MQSRCHSLPQTHFNRRESNVRCAIIPFEQHFLNSHCAMDPFTTDSDRVEIYVQVERPIEDAYAVEFVRIRMIPIAAGARRLFAEASTYAR